MGLEVAHEYRIRLSEDDSLILEDRRGEILVRQSEALLLTEGGPIVLSGREAEQLLPVVANPRLYVGAKLVNSVPRGVKATNEAGLIAGTEVRLTGVYPGSPAEAAGLQEGDVLLSVASSGRKLQISSRQSLATWWCEITAGNVLTFEVRRGSETLQVPVKTRNRSAQEIRGVSSISDEPSYFQRH